MKSQSEKAQTLKALHEREGIFIIPNPWDAGSAKLLTHIGFEALTTTSAGLAFSLGKPDGLAAVSREETLKNAADIVAATHLPVTGDLENGFGHSPGHCAETILRAAQAGLVGGSIEDATGDPNNPIIAFDLALERVKAAVKAARSLPFNFMLCARAENLIYGRQDLKDTIKRLAAFADAGADVLFAPGLKTRKEIETVVKAMQTKPVNVLMNNDDFTLKELEDMGVKRVSLGSSLARAAYSEFLHTANKLAKDGSFHLAKDTVSYSDLNKIFGA